MDDEPEFPYLFNGLLLFSDVERVAYGVLEVLKAAAIEKFTIIPLLKLHVADFYDKERIKLGKKKEVYIMYRSWMKNFHDTFLNTIKNWWS